jgi:hypothetical protein
MILPVLIMFRFFFSIVWFNFSHLDFLEAALTEWNVIEMMSNHDTSMAEVLIGL